MPISTNSAPLTRNVVSVQNALLCDRLRAPSSRGPTWLITSPHTTTASTPDACTTSASRYALNGISTVTVLPSSGSPTRRSPCTPSHATSAPTAIPPRYASANSPATCRAARWSDPTVTPTATA